MNKRIMVVEDESIVRLDIVEMLEDEGWDVVAAINNGEKAIELAEALEPDLIIMDIKMPKLDGIKASEIISKKLDVPILLLTAYTQDEVIKSRKIESISGYLVKPISENNLIPAVKNILFSSQYRNRK
ncbi:response regulator [Siminovitchia fortis]|uniref:Response regulator n=1 Tax=Siminovitchia fortis TaxID=254758 RepID=A0A443IZH3_9BACI|nr:response regulator [Siminovitchia fortis]